MKMDINGHQAYDYKDVNVEDALGSKSLKIDVPEAYSTTLAPVCRT